MDSLAHERRKEEAVRWFGRLSISTPTAADHAEFKRWCNEHPDNLSTYSRARQVWEDLGDLNTLPAARPMLADVDRLNEEIRQLAPRPGVARFKGLRGYAIAASLVVAIIGGLLYFSMATRYTTGTGEIRSLTLPDGSHVTLGAQSRIAYEFDKTRRNLRLKEGEAFFDIRNDPARPFTVEAGGTRIHVLGTQFDVRHRNERTDIAVLEGKVTVSAAAPAEAGVEANPSPTLLAAGQQLTTGQKIASAKPRPTNPIAPPGSWRTGRLSYDGAPLAEVIADVNRYYAPGISLNGSAAPAADLTVTTAFNVDQIEPMINSLTQALPLSATREADGHFVLTVSASAP